MSFVGSLANLGKNVVSSSVEGLFQQLAIAAGVGTQSTSRPVRIVGMSKVAIHVTQIGGIVPAIVRVRIRFDKLADGFVTYESFTIAVIGTPQTLVLNPIHGVEIQVIGINQDGANNITLTTIISAAGGG